MGGIPEELILTLKSQKNWVCGLFFSNELNSAG
jgi:hypothetical protein